MKKALVLGCTGQDGSYLIELLLKKNYKVHGLIRKSATENTKNINHLLKNRSILNKRLFFHKGDLLDIISLSNLINKIKPHEVYNFADQDHVGWSYEIPSYSFSITGSAVINILEILKKKKIKFFQPISSNIFGVSKYKKQKEETKLNPNSIYALGKATALMACKMYNKNYQMFNCGAIFYNHESPRRTNEYVTKKIIQAACEIYHKKKKYLYLGDLFAQIDWGYAKDYVEASWKIMQLQKPDFFIIATGNSYSIRFFLKETFKYLGLDYNKYVRTDKKLIRLSKTSSLVGNTFKAKKEFNYDRNKTPIKKLIQIMIDDELKKYEL